MVWTEDACRRAAAELLRQHHQRERFEGLKHPAELGHAETAYAVQAAWVERRCHELSSACVGYKIALTTQAMQTMVGYADSISGRLIGALVQPGPCTLQTQHYGRLALEFEIAFVMASDLPQTKQPWDRRIAAHVKEARPALELVDDRKADYNTLRHDILTLIADNAWNAGLVLGEPLAGIDLQRLGEISGVALIDGQEVGRGRGSDVLGHPLDALAWLANHLQARGLQLRQGDIITTGSLVKTQFPNSASEVSWRLSGAQELQVSVA
ncbi:MAG: fumarylacetoacetate hydrolase family protein [Betaproteobacteria bacterium]